MHADPMRSRWRAGAVWAAGASALVPLVLVARAVDRYGVNVPFWDQWMMTPLVLAAARGEWVPALIVAQHNEHRPAVPQFLWYVLARCTHWNVRAELAANLVVATATYLVLARLVVETTRAQRAAIAVWGLLVTGVLTFSLAQWENWIWGFQLQVFLNAFGGALVFWMLARWDGNWRRFAAALAASYLAAFSFANGIVLLAGLPVAVLATALTVRASSRLVPVVVAGVAAAAGLTAYFTGWVHPGHHPALGQAAAQPGDSVRYLLAYLGACFSARDATVAARWGAGGIAVFGTCAAVLWWGDGRSRRSVLPWILFGGYAVLTSAVTAIGRVGFGVEQALAPRYVTLTVPFWLAAAVLAGMVGDQWWSRLSRRPFALVGLGVGTVVVALAGAGYVASWREAERRLVERRVVFRAGAECVRFVESAPDACLAAINPVPAHVRQWARDLRTVGYSVFALPPEPALAAYEPAPGMAGYVDTVTAVAGPQGDEVHLWGWAMDPAVQAPPLAVLVAVDGVVFGRADGGERRRDVQRVYGRAMRRSGWTFRFGRFRLAPGTHRLEAWALRHDGRVSALERPRVLTVTADGALEVTP